MLDKLRKRWNKIDLKLIRTGILKEYNGRIIRRIERKLQWDDMSIKKKLILAFIMVGLFSSIVGIFGLGANYRTNENTKGIYDGHFIPAVHLYSIQKNLLQTNSTFLLMLYERDMLQLENRIEKIRDLQKENEELLAKYAVTGMSAELYQTLTKDLTEVNAVMEQLIELLKGLDYTAAMNLAPTFHSRINVVDKDIQKMIDEGIVMAGQSLQDSQSTFYSAFFIMIGISVLCIISAVAAGSMISGRIGGPIAELAEAAEKLASGNVKIKLTTDTNDEVGQLVKAFGKMADNIRTHADSACNIAEGDLNLEIIPLSEEDVLGKSMKTVVSTLNALVAEVREMTLAAMNGDLTCRGRESDFHGGYRDIVVGFNQTLEALIIPLNTSAGCLQKISRGDIPDLIDEEYQGDFNYIKESLNTCIRAVKAMVDDVEMLSAAAVEGKLDIRANMEKHDGDFKKIVGGFNQTLDSVGDPLYVAAEYINKIGNGEIPQPLTGVYYGEFNEIKNSINSCIAGLGALAEGNRILGGMRLNDFSDRVGETGRGIFLEIAESINEVSGNINEIIGYVNHVAAGNLEDLETLKCIGRKSENDILIPSITLMIENLKCVATEINELSEYAIEGRLERRGDAERFQGEYKRIIEGINRTLDAVIEPVQEAFLVLRQLSEGNLNLYMTGGYRGDHAELKNAVNTSISSLLNYIGEIAETLSELSQGNLDLEITGEYKGNFIEIKDSLNHIIMTLNKMIGGIVEAAEHVASGSVQMMGSSRSLAQGSLEQTCTMEGLAASIAETAEHFRQNTGIAADARVLAVSARDGAHRGNSQMERMLESMEKIKESSMSISRINKVIDDIAFQTNILALNAAVEAARAGQHGKGFAVVADEVRRLAARSSEAAKQTAEIIEGSLAAVKSGSNIVNDAAEVFGRILETVDQVTDHVVDISEASERQASNLVVINQEIAQVSSIIQKNSSLAEQSASMSEALHRQAERLTDMVADFRYRNHMDTKGTQRQAADLTED